MAEAITARHGEASGSRTISWKQSALILFSFASPSAVMAVPYLIGMMGYIGGILVCVVVIASSVGGSLMLLQIRLAHPACRTFGQLGKEVMGLPGQVWGNLAQIGNFTLFLPCALQFCALALEGIGSGISAFGNCNDYYVFTIASVCLMTTQARKLSNTTVLSYLSVLSVIGMCVCVIVAALAFENKSKVPARMFGNPEGDPTVSLVKAAGGFTIAAWCYVPAFLTVELVGFMDDPSSFTKSLLLSAAMTILMILIVGFTTVARWGYEVGEVITITEGVDAWKPGSSIKTAFNVFQLLGNFVSYMLDSVPLGRFCQMAWAPTFRDTWSAADTLRYLGYTLPTFLFALLLAVLVPSVNTLLDFTTAFTVPMVTQIYPSVLYWRLFCRRGSTPILHSGTSSSLSTQEDVWRESSLRRRGSSPIPDLGTALPLHAQDIGEVPEASVLHKLAVVSVFIVGCCSSAVCFLKAVGYLVLDELRPPMRIGCAGWTVWSGGVQATLL